MSSVANSILVIWIPLLICIGLLIFKLVQLNSHIETSLDGATARNSHSGNIFSLHQQAILSHNATNNHLSPTGSGFSFLNSFQAHPNPTVPTSNQQQQPQPQSNTQPSNLIAPTKPPIRIAYIFAGSVRSFICPHVHWSLRFNAIDALGGEAYTFIRVSTEDNKNTRTGKGVVWTPKYSEDNILETLKILNPRKLEFFSLSTQEEEMKKNFPSEIHTVFRENDLRRYSMYYHRCMGYRLAMEYEKEHNITFDWVALIRLDAAWLEPLLPIEYYSNDRVWLTETGYVAFNDQFMLIPRQFSDYLYDLDTKVNKKVYCLGGPDVEQWKCNATHLAIKGVSKEKMDTTLQYCCADVFGNNNIGFSETIHYRHLLEGRIPVSLARFPVYITRYFDYCLADCDRLHYNFKLFNYEIIQYNYPYFAPMSAVDTRAQMISSTDTDQCYVTTHTLSLYKPFKATEYNAQISAGKYPAIDYGKSLYDQWDLLPEGLRFNQHYFHPWKIHASGNAEGCLSVTMNRTFEWDICRNHARFKGGRRYHPQQTFYLLVQPHTFTMLQSPLLLAPKHGRQSFLINHPSAWPNNFPNVTRIMFPGHVPRWYNLNGQLYCFTANPNKGWEIDLQPCVSTYEKNPHQWFEIVRGETQGSHPLSTVAKMKLLSRPGYCIIRSSSKEIEETEIPAHNRLTVAKCDHTAFPASQRYFEFEIIQP